MVRKDAVAGVIGIATWVIEVPLAASVAHLESRGPSATATCWFLAALSAGLVLRTLYPAVLKRPAVSWGALVVNVLATLLMRGALLPAGCVLMGVATGAGLPAATGVIDALLDPDWTGRLVTAAVGGVTLVHWGLDLLRAALPPVAVFLLVLAFLVVGWAAMGGAGAGRRAAGVPGAPVATAWPAAGTSVSVGLFVLLFALIGGISARFMLGTAAVLTAGDVLVRLLFIGGLAAGSLFLAHAQTQRIAVAAAALLVAAFFADRLGWGAAVPPLSASAFGVLEPIPWFVIARHATASPGTRWWAGAGTALFVLRFGIAIPITARIDEQVLVLLGLPGALALLLALLLVPDLLSLQPQAAPTERTAADEPEEPDEPDAAAGAPGGPEARVQLAAGLAAPAASVDTGRLLERHYGDRLSPRELEIGSLAVAGVSTREIAERLFLTENTVKYHLKNLFRKTGAENRHDLYRKLVAANRQSPGA